MKIETRGRPRKNPPKESHIGFYRNTCIKCGDPFIAACPKPSKCYNCLNGGDKNG